MSRQSRQHQEREEAQAGEATTTRERGVVYLLIGVQGEGTMNVLGVFPGMGSAMKEYAGSMRTALEKGIELSVLKCHELVGTTIRQTARPPKAE